MQTQTHFFSQAKAPVVYSITEIKNHNTNNTDRSSAPATCLNLDKGNDTKPPSTFNSLFLKYLHHLCYTIYLTVYIFRCSTKSFLCDLKKV